MNTETLLECHRRHAWQPFTQMKLTPDPIVIERARGVYLYASDGREIIDAVGSWWVCVHGHNHPYINEAIIAQLEKIEHVMYSGFTHEPAALLGKRLAETTGGALPRVFFSDNGSTAVEIGLKMAFQYFTNQGRPEKKEIVTLEGGYHGDTIGTMSVGARSVFHAMYAPLLFPVHHAKTPRCRFADWRPDAAAPDASDANANERANANANERAGANANERANTNERASDSARAIAVERALESAVADLRRIFESRGESICAFILEPLIQGAGGMNFYPPEYLRAARALCDKYDIFLIADEVFTGCGRTGSFHACRQAGIWPDICALSKGLSAGYTAFAATLASEKVFQGFYSDNRLHTFFHGHSMTANPLGCAAAGASLDLLESEERLADGARLERLHRRFARDLECGALGGRIRETRALGTVAAIELDLDEGYVGEFGWRFWQNAIARGALLRPLGRVIYLTPPYVISEEELARVYDILEKTALELLSK